jgi:superfamily II DNA or RNA helicase
MSNDELQRVLGYHPLPQDVLELARIASVSRLLILGPDVPDVVRDVSEVRFVSTPEIQLNRGVYWFPRAGVLDALLVVDGLPPAASEVLDVSEEQAAEHPLTSVAGWFDALWPDAQSVPPPKFNPMDEVIVVSSGQDAIVRSRTFAHGMWLYELRLEGRLQSLAEDLLDFFPENDDPAQWLAEGPSPVERFAATLTRSKLEGSFTDTVFSFRSTRTMFRPYQFKPVIKFLETGKSRLLIADEVGLGKTIEAGLIWTELEARRSADRVLIVSPSNLVTKWKIEMEERFNFQLEELNSKSIAELEERARTGRLPSRAAYIGSLERLRQWDNLEELAPILPQFDLVIFDEAHYLRNTDTKSNAFAALLGELTDNMVFLSATPVNLRNDDLFNLLELLNPGEFEDKEDLEQRIEPNAALHRIAETLSEPEMTAQKRVALLDSLAGSVFGAQVLRRSEAAELRQLLEIETLAPADKVAIRGLLAELNALSSVITRTRKAEVDEAKAIREPRIEEVNWEPDERDFYREYYAWCVRRAAVAGAPLAFSQQMPLRLASACLPAARDRVLNWQPGAAEVQDDGELVVPTPSSQVAPHPELLAAARALGDVDSKFDRLEELVLELKSQKRQSLLFTFSRPTLAYLKARLAPHMRVAVLHGGVPQDQRRDIMARFRAGEYDMVLANRVASEGLDFEFCSVVINYDLPWNPMEVEQRIGRIDRIGQSEQKIFVINFHNPDTIDESILLKVLDRIGIFERSIGALEPIIMSRLPELQKAMLDFELSDTQRLAKTDQALQAIEAQSANLEDLASATNFLLVSNDVDVAGMEDELLRSGRYVGHQELVHLLRDWSETVNASGISLAPDGRTAAFRGNSKMAQQLQGLVAAQRRSSSEVHDIIGQLHNELEIPLVLDPDLAREGGGQLLSVNHPLVLGALSVPGFRQSRFTTIQLDAADTPVKSGRYLVYMGVAEWSGLRPSKEIWGVAIDQDGNEAHEALADVVLAQLARGTLAPASAHDSQAVWKGQTQRAQSLLQRRQVLESETKKQRELLLRDERRLSLQSHHQRKMAVIEQRIETAEQRGRDRVLPAFRAQQLKAQERFDRLIRELDEGTASELRLTPLALCEIKVGDD